MTAGSQGDFDLLNASVVGLDQFLKPQRRDDFAISAVECSFDFVASSILDRGRW
jgi:hypothetical protein